MNLRGIIHKTMQRYLSGILDPTDWIIPKKLYK